MEVYWLPSMDTWKTCVTLTFTMPQLIMSRFYSRLREKCPLVCPPLAHSTLVELTISI